MLAAALWEFGWSRQFTLVLTLVSCLWQVAQSQRSEAEAPERLAGDQERRHG